MPTRFPAGSTGRLAVGFVLAAGLVGPAAAGPFEVRRDIVYARPGNTPLLLDAYVPAGAGPFPAVLVVHGGAWRQGSKAQLGHVARQLAGAGYVAVAINYRLAPRYPFPAQIEDCRSAVRWILANAAKYRVDPARLGAIGYSAGGHLVAMLAAQGVPVGSGANRRVVRLKAVAAGGAPCDFRDMPLDAKALAYWLGGTRRQKPKQYVAASPAAFVTGRCSPVFFYHGQADLLVNPAQPRRMYEALRRAKVETALHIVPGAGHILAAVNRPALEAARKFLDRHLKASPAAERRPARPGAAAPTGR